MTGGGGICVSMLTIERAHHKKNALMGTQKGLHSKGCIHIYTHVPFHVFLQILSCTSPLGCRLPEKLFVLTEACTVQALFASTEPIPSRIGAQFDRQEKGIRPAKKCDALYIRDAKSADSDSCLPPRVGPDNLREG